MQGRRLRFRWLRWPLTALGLILAYGPLVLDFLQFRSLGFSPLGWMALGTTLFVVVAAISLHGLTKENDHLRSLLTPALELSFDPSAPLFTQRRRRFLSITNPIVAVLVRVKVKNLSSNTSVDEVKVRVLQIDPPSLRSTWPLREKDDDAGVVSREGFTLHPGEERYIDLVMREEAGGEFEFMLATPHDAVGYWRQNRVPVRQYRFTLVAEGRDVPPCKKAFSLDASQDGGILLQPE